MLSRFLDQVSGVNSVARVPNGLWGDVDIMGGFLPYRRQTFLYRIMEELPVTRPESSRKARYDR